MSKIITLKNWATCALTGEKLPPGSVVALCTKTRKVYAAGTWVYENVKQYAAVMRSGR
jgi:hypothetical protein